MPYQKLVAVCLAFLLAFSCYPLSCTNKAFADETLPEQSFEDGDLVAGGLESGFGIDAAGVEPFGGSPILPPVADVGDSAGSDIGSDGDSFDSADEIASFPGGVTAYAAAPIVSELGKKVLAALGGAAINSLANNLVSTLGGSKPSVSETLLAAILGWQSILSDDNGTINTRLLNLYNLVNQMYTHDIKGIYSLITHIGVNTDLLKTYTDGLEGLLSDLKSYSSEILGDTHWQGYLSGQGTADFSVAALLGRIYNSNYSNFSWLGGFLHWEGYLPGFGQADFSLAALVERFYEVSRSSLSNINSNLVWSGNLTGYGEGTFSAAALLNRLYEMSRSRLGLIADYSVWHGSLVGHGEADFSSASILGRFYNLCADFFPRFASMQVNAAFDDSNIVSYLSRILTALSEDGAIAVAVSVDTSALQALRDGELKAIYDQLLAMGSFAGDGVLAKLDEITDLLLIAGAKDLVETIVGDFSQITDAVQSSALESVLQSAFPFCIPAVLKQLMGLLEYEAAAPVFDFEIGGQPMHVDASAAQGFADMVSWACRFLFLFGLLVSTRKFIYTGVAQ